MPEAERAAAASAVGYALRVLSTPRGAEGAAYELEADPWKAIAPDSKAELVKAKLDRIVVDEKLYRKS